jgi:hypothetical protein
MPDLTYYPQWRQSTNRVLTDGLVARTHRALDQATAALDAAGVKPEEQFQFSGKVDYDTEGWGGKSWGQKSLSELKYDPQGVKLSLSGPSWVAGRESASKETFTIEKGTRLSGFRRVPAQIYTHVFENQSDGTKIRQEAAFVGGELRFGERISATNWRGALRAAVSVVGVTAAAAGAVVGAQFGLAGALVGAPLAFGALATAFRFKIPGLATTKDFLGGFPMDTLALRDRNAWD